MVTQCSQFFRQTHFCKKTGVFLAKIRALDGQKDGQNSSLARLWLRSAAPLRVQSVIEPPKQLTNALKLHRIAKRRAKLQKYGR